MIGISGTLSLYLGERNYELLKLKAFEDDKLNVVETIVIVCDGAENFVGKRENNGKQLNKTPDSKK